MKSRIVPILFFLTINIIFVGDVRCEIPLNGRFIATRACEAMKSFRKGTNPGNVTLTVDMAYEITSKNKVNATHYRIKVKGATPKERWVSAACGIVLTDCRVSGPGEISGESSFTSGSPRYEYLLALSWQPAFCQNHQDKIECVTQTEDRYDASHFTLHGLWPQPKNNVYCNVSNTNITLDKRKMWSQLPYLGLEEDTYGDLIEVMPGVASYLHRHEWFKHGTCYSESPEEYFEESMMLLDQINESAIRDFFVANTGKRVSVSDIKAVFSTDFGREAGDKLCVKCNDGMITELWINLKGDITESSQLEALMQNAQNASGSCQEGLIDPVGY